MLLARIVAIALLALLAGCLSEASVEENTAATFALAVNDELILRTPSGKTQWQVEPPTTLSTMYGGGPIFSFASDEERLIVAAAMGVPLGFQPVAQSEHLFQNGEGAWQSVQPGGISDGTLAIWLALVHAATEPHGTRIGGVDYEIDRDNNRIHGAQLPAQLSPLTYELGANSIAIHGPQGPVAELELLPSPDGKLIEVGGTNVPKFSHVDYPVQVDGLISPDAQARNRLSILDALLAAKDSQVFKLDGTVAVGNATYATAPLSGLFGAGTGVGKPGREVWDGTFHEIEGDGYQRFVVERIKDGTGTAVTQVIDQSDKMARTWAWVATSGVQTSVQQATDWLFELGYHYASINVTLVGDGFAGLEPWEDVGAGARWQIDVFGTENPTVIGLEEAGASTIRGSVWSAWETASFVAGNSALRG